MLAAILGMVMLTAVFCFAVALGSVFNKPNSVYSVDTSWLQGSM